MWIVKRSVLLPKPLKLTLVVAVFAVERALYLTLPLEAMAKIVRVVFEEWRTWTLKCRRSSLEWEVSALEKGRDRKEVDSLWKMRKAELEEVARRELGMTKSDLMDETVVSLRERIRAARSQFETDIDPLTTIPKGLDRMTVSQLVDACFERDLDPMAHDGKKEYKTRPQMIVLIRDDVKQRISTSATKTPSTTGLGAKPKKTSAPSGPRNMPNGVGMDVDR